MRTAAVCVLTVLLSGAVGWTFIDFFGLPGVLLAVPATCLLGYGAAAFFAIGSGR